MQDQQVWGTRIVPVKLGDAEIGIEAIVDERAAAPGIRALEQPFDDLVKVLGRAVHALGEVLKAAEPSKAAVQFGFSFKLESDKLIAVLVKAGANASISVTIEWQRS